VGVIVSTLMAFMLRLDRDTIRNGIFGYNGMLVGAALATFGDMDASPWPWAIAVIIFSALTTVLMNTFGVWWAKTVKTPPLTLPFIIATLVCLVLAKSLPFLGLNLPTASDSATLQTLNFSDLGASLAIGIGQVFLVGNLLPGLLIVLAIGLCSPLGAGVGLLGALLGLVVSLILQAPLNSVYAGLWGYNAVLTAMALGGVFYAPNLRSVGIGAIAALVSAGIGGLLSLLVAITGSSCPPCSD